MRNRTEIKVTLSLLRHGATPANREHRYLGKTDEALSEEGRAELLLKKKEIPAELLLVSPMLRCRQTAEILSRAGHRCRSRSGQRWILADSRERITGN